MDNWDRQSEWPDIHRDRPYDEPRLQEYDWAYEQRPREVPIVIIESILNELTELDAD